MEYSVTIGFGSNEDLRKATEETFEFATEAELEAFLKGVEAGNGWMDYEIVEATE
jgi:hypothetical protein